MAYEFESEVIQHELEDEFSGEGEEEFSGESSFEGEGEDETAYESSFESALESEEGELNPIRKIYPDAMMEHLGELAADAETEEEAADHFLPLIGMAASKLLPVVAKAVAPMAKQALPKIARAVTRATPHLTRGVGNMAKALHRNPQTRHLLRTVPTIARRTVGSIAKQAAHGRPITPGTAVRTLAQQTRRVLAHPQQRRRALRRHNNLERRFHGRYAPGLARQHWRWFRGRRYPFPAGTAGAPHPAGVPTPGAVRQAGAGAAMPGVRRGQMVGGQCTCAPCPTCGAASGAQPTASAAPAYCRCCGQVLR
jgi:hypothetical protein